MAEQFPFRIQRIGIFPCGFDEFHLKDAAGTTICAQLAQYLFREGQRTHGNHHQFRGAERVGDFFHHFLIFVIPTIEVDDRVDMEPHKDTGVGRFPRRRDTLVECRRQVFLFCYDRWGVEGPGGYDIPWDIHSFDPVRSCRFGFEFNHHGGMFGREISQRRERAVIITPKERIRGLPRTDMPDLRPDPQLFQTLREIPDETDLMLMVERLDGAVGTGEPTLLYDVQRPQIATPGLLSLDRAGASAEQFDIVAMVDDGLQLVRHDLWRGEIRIYGGLSSSLRDPLQDIVDQQFRPCFPCGFSRDIGIPPGGKGACLPLSQVCGCIDQLAQLLERKVT